jgi:hypothetical protein
MHRVFVVLTGIALLAGCGVSNQVFAEKESEVETCRSQLNECKSFLEIRRPESIRLQEGLNSCEATRSRAAADLGICSTARDGTEANLSKATRDRHGFDRKGRAGESPFDRQHQANTVSSSEKGASSTSHTSTSRG